MEATRIQLLAGSIDSKEIKPIIYTSSNATYAHGHLLFTRERTLMAQRFDPDRLELKGDAVPIAENVALFSSLIRAAFSISQNGILAYQTGDAQAASTLDWYDRSWAQKDTVGEPADYRDVSLSRDGATAAVSIYDEKTDSLDLWMVDLVRGIRTRFTFEDSQEILAIWSPDGAQVAFSSDRRGSVGTFQKTADGSGEAEFIQEIEGHEMYCTSWSPDGQQLACGALDASGKTGWDIFLLSVSENANLTPLIQTRFNEDWPAFSPDGRWLAYMSNESGTGEIYVRPFPIKGGKWQVSVAGGTQPQWGQEGKELFYLAPGGILTVAQLEPGEKSLKVGHIESLSPTGILGFSGLGGRPYNVAPDGQRFLVIEPVEQSGVPPVTLVVNWTAELNK
jgi:Tol biopolymer transport system component